MKYELKYDAIPFIMEKAGEAAKLSLLQAAGPLETRLAKGLMLAILKRQNPDGGFPNQFDRKVSGLKITYTTTALLVRCGMPAQCFAIQ